VKPTVAEKLAAAELRAKEAEEALVDRDLKHVGI
jgi:hypothetical protein